MTRPAPVRWGFLGAGFVAARAMGPAVHAADGAVLHVVASRDSVRAVALGPVRTTDSYDAVCTASDVDAVYLSLPNDAHLPWVLQALGAGKHVLCEKPLGLDAAEVATMSAAATASGRLLVEASWNRWHPRTRRAERLLAHVSGPRQVDAEFTFSGVPAQNYRLQRDKGGGALLDVGCYVVAAALAALGPGEVEVVDVQRRLGPTGVDLTTSALLSHPDGRANVTASFERPESQVFRVVAPGLSLELSAPAFASWRQPSSLLVTEGDRVHEERFGACDPYQLMIEAVSAKIRGDDAWVLPLSTSAQVAATLDAIARTIG